MAKTLYTWNDITYADDKGNRKTLRRGETVTASKLNIDNDELQELVLSRAVRETKYPDMPSDYTGSPRDFLLEQRKRELADIDDLEDAIAAAEVEARNEAEATVTMSPDETPEIER